MTATQSVLEAKHAHGGGALASYSSQRDPKFLADPLLAHSLSGATRERLAGASIALWLGSHENVIRDLSAIESSPRGMYALVYAIRDIPERQRTELSARGLAVALLGTGEYTGGRRISEQVAEVVAEMLIDNEGSPRGAELTRRAVGVLHRYVESNLEVAKSAAATVVTGEIAGTFGVLMRAVGSADRVLSFDSAQLTDVQKRAACTSFAGAMREICRCQGLAPENIESSTYGLSHLEVCDALDKVRAMSGDRAKSALNVLSSWLAQTSEDSIGIASKLCSLARHVQSSIQGPPTARSDQEILKWMRASGLIP